MPLPEDGVTETVATVTVPGTVQVPITTQPLWPLKPCTCIFVFFDPAKPAVKLTARFTVRLFPAVLVLLPLPLIVHWLLLKEFDDPTVIGPRKALPASFSR